MTDGCEEDVEHIIKCFECLSRNIVNDYNRGEIYCNDCGLVLDEEMMEEKSSGRERPGDILSDRTHEMVKESYNLGSQVGNRLVDGSYDRSRLGRRLRLYDKRVKITPEQKNEIRGIMACRMLAANLGTSEDIKEQAAFMYKQVYKMPWVRGISVDVRAAAILFWVFKVNGMNRKMHEVVAHNGAHPRQTTKLVRKLASHFRQPWLLSQRNFAGDIEKFCGQLQMESKATAETLKLSIPIEQMGEERCLSMNTGYVAAIMYIAIQCRNYSIRTQREISTATGITEVTLRSNFKVICRAMGINREALKNGVYTVDDIVSGAYRNE
jgi:transcription initiation factor TFIIB